MDQERQIAEAKERGEPIPVFPALISAPKPYPTGPKKPRKGLTQLSPEHQAAFQKRIKGLTAEEQELEEKAFLAELGAGRDLATAYVSIMSKQDAEREKRKQEGKETIGDKIVFAFRVRESFSQSEAEAQKAEAKEKDAAGEEPGVVDKKST